MNNIIKKIEVILSIIFIIAGLAFTVYYCYGAIEAKITTSNLMNDKNGYLVAAGIFGRIGSTLILGFAVLLLVLLGISSWMLLRAYKSKPEEGNKYITSSVTFLIVSIFYIYIVSTFYFTTSYKPINFVMITSLIQIISYIPLFIVKIISIVLKKKELKKNLAN